MIGDWPHFLNKDRRDEYFDKLIGRGYAVKCVEIQVQQIRPRDIHVVDWDSCYDAAGFSGTLHTLMTIDKRKGK